MPILTISETNYSNLELYARHLNQYIKNQTMPLDDSPKTYLFFPNFFQFRSNLQDVLNETHDDYFLMRWLRARKWDPEQAEKMLRAVSKTADSDSDSVHMHKFN